MERLELMPARTHAQTRLSSRYSRQRGQLNRMDAGTLSTSSIHPVARPSYVNLHGPTPRGHWAAHVHLQGRVHQFGLPNCASPA